MSDDYKRTAVFGTHPNDHKTTADMTTVMAYDAGLQDGIAQGRAEALREAIEVCQQVHDFLGALPAKNASKRCIRRIKYLAAQEKPNDK